MPTNEPEASGAVERNASIGMWLGLAALLLSILPIAALPLAITGLVYARRGLATAWRRRAIGALILNALAIAIALTSAIAGYLYGTRSAA